jgi:hypothetical protein
MNLGFGNPLPLIIARMVTQSGTAAAAWSGMWYGLTIGAINAATRSAVQPEQAAEPGLLAKPEPPATVARPPAKATARKSGPARR